MTSPIAAPPHIHALLARLHQTSLDQEAALKKDKASKRFVSTDADDGPAAFDALMRDKLIALDADKCHFAYQLVRAKGATTVVEAGTSFGVSTIYLALGVGRNARDLGEVGRVVATEKEGEKAAVARGYWRECGEEVEAYVDLREGDLLEMLREGVEDVDLLLLDSECSILLVVLLFPMEGCTGKIAAADGARSLDSFGFADAEAGATEDAARRCCVDG